MKFYKINKGHREYTPEQMDTVLQKYSLTETTETIINIVTETIGRDIVTVTLYRFGDKVIAIFEKTGEICTKDKEWCLCRECMRQHESDKRVAYVYHCIQGQTDLERRETEKQRLIVKKGLNAAEIALVDSYLANLDERRRKKEEQEQSKPKDPYWSLWGKLKFANQRFNLACKKADELYEYGSTSSDECAAVVMEEAEAEKQEYRLPRRGVVVEYDDGSLIVNGKAKRINGDMHAVNTLRKLDNDDVYFRKITE